MLADLHKPTKGITSIQMDIKIDRLSKKILQESLEQAKIGRLHILNSMLATIHEPKSKLSPYAPKILTMHINPDKIRDVIGPSGKQINKIIEETGVKMTMKKDEKDLIHLPKKERMNKPKRIMKN